MHFLSVVTTLLVTASVTVAVPGSNAAQASCQSVCPDSSHPDLVPFVASVTWINCDIQTVLELGHD